MEIITVNYLFGTENFKIEPSSIKRDWMDNTKDKFAYRCLPMTMANQHSWDVKSPGDVDLEWNGDEGFDGVKISTESNLKFASSLFGYGIVTFHIDFVLQTKKNISIYVKGPANAPKQKIVALEGIVETNWLPFTFTMNWKFTEPGTVRFAQGEPLFSFFPLDMNDIEKYCVKSQNINENPNFKIEYDEYSSSRKEHLKTGETDGQSWQKYYMKGIHPISPEKNTNHKTKLNLKKVNE